MVRADGGIKGMNVKVYEKMAEDELEKLKREAFRACEYLIDELKKRVPIRKKEV